MYRLWKGRKVEIWNVDKTKILGEGIYIGSERGYSKVFGYMGWIPKFRLKNRKVIYGFECWWIPSAITKKLLKEKLCQA